MTEHVENQINFGAFAKKMKDGETRERSIWLVPVGATEAGGTGLMACMDGNEAAGGASVVRGGALNRFEVYFASDRGRGPSFTVQLENIPPGNADGVRLNVRVLDDASGHGAQFAGAYVRV